MNTQGTVLLMYKTQSCFELFLLFLGFFKQKLQFHSLFIFSKLLQKHNVKRNESSQNCWIMARDYSRHDVTKMVATNRYSVMVEYAGVMMVMGMKSWGRGSEGRPIVLK